MRAASAHHLIIIIKHHINNNNKTVSSIFANVASERIEQKQNHKKIPKHSSEHLSRASLTCIGVSAWSSNVLHFKSVATRGRDLILPHL